MRILLTLAFLPMLALSLSPIYVANWPDRLPVSGGVCFSPTPAQCRAAGYELEANRPPPSAAEIAAAQAAAQAAAGAVATAESNRLSRLRTLLDTYHGATTNLCAIAGIDPAVAVSNELTSAQINALCFPLLDDVSDTGKLKRNTKIIAIALRLENLSRTLEREGYLVAR